MGFINVSRHNRKLVPNKDTAFIIWNLPAVTTCPYRTGHCEKDCYARKAERVYPAVLPSRQRNFELSLTADFVYDMIATIMRIRRHSKAKQVIVRIHESGDFYNKEYADKWIQIMRGCARDKSIHFIAYTKSFPYFDGLELPENFSLRASVWDDTPQWALDMIQKNDWPIYTAVEKFTDNDAFHHCRCEDCATCGKCWSDEKMIACEIH